MTLTAAERAAISRQNGQKSRGPRSAETKSRTRLNALKHGLKAKTVVLPGEDPQEYQGRLDAWIADLQPTNDVEQALVERAVTITWQLDRAERAETARLAGLIRVAPAEAVLRQEEEAAALGQRLFHDRRGPLPLYPHSLYSFPGQPRVSSSGLSDDPDAPPRLLLRLESTAAGCRWLLDRWAELRGLLDRGQTWQSADKLKAIRLLGRQPLEAADSEVVATVFQSCHVLDPQVYHQAGAVRDDAVTLVEAISTLQTMAPGAFARLGDQPGSRAAVEPGADPDPHGDRDESDEGEMDRGDAAAARLAWQGCGAAFTELLGELTKEEARAYRHRLEGRRVDQLRPKDPAAARATLLAIVERAAIRLEARRELHEAHAAVESAEAVVRLGFDVSLEGERLRRFQLAGQRGLLRTVDTLLKLRRQEPTPQNESDPAEPTSMGATGDGLSMTPGLGPEETYSLSVADPLPAVPDFLARPQPASESEHAAENRPNEPAAASDVPPSAPADSPTAPGELQISPNEPDPAPRASSDSPPTSAAASGKVPAVGTVAAGPSLRVAPRDDSLPPARQDRPRADAGHQPTGWTKMITPAASTGERTRGLTPESQWSDTAAFP
jgi:hypothetical protein